VADALGHIWVKSDLESGSADLPIAVSVRDNGTGIRPENRSKLFEIRWSTKGGRGMGFGLFWTSDYLDGIGGSIEADSTWGEGTTFTIRLPRNVQSDAV
jgi:signal transduction histidine kinase